MGLQPLEFSECIADSPYFREALHAHEKELDQTSKAIKGLIQECNNLLSAAKNLSKAQRSFSSTLSEFKFECIGNDQTDEEKIITQSLREFGKLISDIEDERDRVLERASEQIIKPLELFRKEKIGEAKEGRKKFEKQTAKFCQSLERNLNLKAKSTDIVLQEADASLDLERINFFQASMQYVLLLQNIQERKKFEFVEILLTFMYGWLTFYHQGHEVAQEFRSNMTDLQLKIQKCRCSFDTSQEQAKKLMDRTLEVRGLKPSEQLIAPRDCSKEGYLFIMEKKAFGTTWTKCYCTYKKESKIFTSIPYNQMVSKGISTETYFLTSCTRRSGDSIEKRFCFDITVQDRPTPITIQAISENDRSLWLDVMDGKEPIYSQPARSNELDTLLDDIGFQFLKRCIKAIELRGLTDQGLYRVVGVNSKVNKLVNMGLDRRKLDKIDLEDSKEWEVKTITSAVKSYLRYLPEPLMSFRLHYKLIKASKNELKEERVNEIHYLIHTLPKSNFEMLDFLIKHLTRVSDKCKENLMTVSNLGVVFGPTLMRPEEETLAAIMDIKFCNIIVEILIENYDTLFLSKPSSEFETAAKSVTNHNPASQKLFSAPNKTVTKTTPSSNNTISILASGVTRLPPRPPINSISINNLYQTGSTSSPSTPSSSEKSTSQPNLSQSPTLAGANRFTPDFKLRSPNLTGGTNNHGSQTYAQYRARLKPVGIYNQFSPDHHSSTSSSSESLNSRGTGLHLSNPSFVPGTSHGQSVADSGRHPTLLNESASQVLPVRNISISSAPMNKVELGTTSLKKRHSVDSITFSLSPSTYNDSSKEYNRENVRRVRTLYSCQAENDSELSFEPNQIIVNVRQSKEPGWLEGALNGKTGLLPANYVEYIN